MTGSVPPKPEPAEAADLSSWMRHPHRIAVDGKGYVWRAYPDMWSMAPVNPDNSPIPQPVRFYDYTEDLAAYLDICADLQECAGNPRAAGVRWAAQFLREYDPLTSDPIEGAL